MQQNSHRMGKDETETKYIGVSIALPLHKKLRQIAARDELSMSSLLREALVERLEREQLRE